VCPSVVKDIPFQCSFWVLSCSEVVDEQQMSTRCDTGGAQKSSPRSIPEITLPLMSETERQLYAIYLGGDPAPGRIGEDHEVVFVVAPDVTSARRLARGKWKGDDPKPHVDMVQELDVIDGYEVSLSPTNRSSSAEPDATYEASPDETPDPGND
jgi:hypothetical protein